MEAKTFNFISAHKKIEKINIDIGDIINSLKKKGEVLLKSGFYCCSNNYGKFASNIANKVANNSANKVAEKKEYTECEHENKVLKITGVMKKGEIYPVLFLSKCMEILNQGALFNKKLIFKNILFIKDAEYPGSRNEEGCKNKASVFINIKANVDFINCGFLNFPGVAVNCCEKSNVIFNKCVFNGNELGINALDYANVGVKNCRFNNTSGNCFNMSGESVFKIEKTNIKIENGCALALFDNASGSVEYCDFKSSANKSIETSAIESDTKNKINIYKCNFSLFEGAVACGSSSKVNVIECDFTGNEQSIGSIEQCEMFISSCNFYKNNEVSILVSDDSEVRVFDSKIKNNNKHGVFLQKYGSIRIYNTEISSNDGHGIVHMDTSYVFIRESNINNNEGAGIYSNEESSCDISHCVLFDNKLFNIALFGSSDMICESNDLYYTKDAGSNSFSLYNIACRENAKAHVKNNKLHSYKKDTGGLLTGDSAEVFAKNCTFETMDCLALLQGKSNIYVKESRINDIKKCLAIGEGDSTLSIVDCNVKAYREKKN